MKLLTVRDPELAVLAPPDEIRRSKYPPAEPHTC